MNEGNILDNDFKEVEKNHLFKFQIVDIALIGFFCSLLVLKPFFGFSKIEKLILMIPICINIFSMVRIYLEYQKKLITGFGVYLKVILLVNTNVILIGVLFKLLNWPYASEMITTALLSIGYPYALYVLSLKGISISTKIILFFNALFTGLLAIGMLFKIQHWAYGSELVIVGFIMTIISLLLCGFIFRKEINSKEKYHSINYIARSLIILFFGFLYSFIKMKY